MCHGVALFFCIYNGLATSLCCTNSIILQSIFSSKWATQYGMARLDALLPEGYFYFRLMNEKAYEWKRYGVMLQKVNLIVLRGCTDDDLFCL
jgi:hypothetical protein